ncbi:MAG: penicillin acylase family protein, partial [Rhodospirillaceae bacterium]|nr:penicillin acylase family protein [Rhodospirillaceae bacterium]
MVGALTRWSGAALWAAHALRHALATPPPPRLPLEDRLAMIPCRGLPIAAPVRIYWDRHQVPYIDAEHDRDLAVALGVVHAHLRLAQLELMRHIARGRLAELVGPLAAGLDHGLRLIDFGRAVPAIAAALPADTRTWLEGFVAGINHHVAHAETMPPELALLGIGRTPWRVEDVLTIGRLAASDVSWLVWLRLLRLRDAADWPAPWRRLVEASLSITGA